MARKPTDVDPKTEKALIRMLERRFGRSMLPYCIKPVKFGGFTDAVWRCRDTETGSFVIARYSSPHINGKRYLYVLQEHDGSAA